MINSVSSIREIVSRRSPRTLLRLGIKPPQSSGDALYSALYRLVMISVCGLICWVSLVVVSLVLQSEPQPWLFILIAILAMPALIVGEFIRRGVFQMMLREEVKEVELLVTSSGISVVADDRDFLKNFFSRGASGLHGIRGVYARVLKRPLDILLVISTSPALVPVVLLLAALIKLDGGPAYVYENRLGRGGRLFRLWSFRTTEYCKGSPGIGNEAEREYFNDEAGRGDVQLSDIRVTKIGRMLHRTSLSELPQLFNVLIGDMSLVGPRPLLPEQATMYQSERYYQMRPGITGFWQTAGRNATSFAARAWYDDKYAENISFVNDMKIFYRTYMVVLRVR